MSIRYTLRHNIPLNKVVEEQNKYQNNLNAENVNDILPYDFDLLRKHELAETDNNTLVYRTHDGDILLWDDAMVSEYAAQLYSRMLNQSQHIDEALERMRDLDQMISDFEQKVDSADQLMDDTQDLYQQALTLPIQWAIKMDGMVEQDGDPVDYSAKWYALLAKDWANKTSGTVADGEYSAKYYALQAGASATTASTAATNAASSASDASSSATTASTAATNASNSATAAAASATIASQYASNVSIMTAAEVETLFESIVNPTTNNGGGN